MPELTHPHARSRTSQAEDDRPLSPRERQIIALIAIGASNKEIGQQLFITERTVKAHLSSVFRKLQVSSRLQLAIQAMRGNISISTNVQ